MTATGAVIFLHGSGDTGRGLERWLGAAPFVQALKTAGVRVEFPSAKPIPYTLFGGRTMSVWFDRYAMEPSSPERTESVEASCSQLEMLLDDVVASGVAPSRILIGGFSMGGGIALQTALRSKHAVGGIFAMSSYLCDDAAVYSLMAARATPPRPSIWMAHGRADGFVLPTWGEGTAEKLRGAGLDVRWKGYDNLRHEMRQDELDDLNEWMRPLVLGTSRTVSSSATEGSGDGALSCS